MVFGSESGQPSMTAFPYPHFMRPLAYDWNRAEARAQLARGDAEFAQAARGEVRFGARGETSTREPVRRPRWASDVLAGRDGVGHTGPCRC